MPEPRNGRSATAIEKCRRAYAGSKKRLAAVGFICEGTLVVRRMCCGKSTCACRTDVSKRHGPYYQLSWKEGGKTVSRCLDPDAARLYQGWQDNRRRLDSILQDLRVISQQARSVLLPQSSPGPRVKKPHGRARTPPSATAKPRDIGEPRP
jgi:hypothetical protein